MGVIGVNIVTYCRFKSFVSKWKKRSHLKVHGEVADHVDVVLELLRDPVQFLRFQIDDTDGQEIPLTAVFEYIELRIAAIDKYREI